MQYFSIMQSFQSSNNLDKYVPYFFFFDVSFSLLIATYFLEDITVVSILHNETTNKKEIMVKRHMLNYLYVYVP
jgi:hypothetical protein